MGDGEAGPGEAACFSDVFRTRVLSVLKDEGLESDLSVAAGAEDAFEGEHFMSTMHCVRGSGRTPDGTSVTIPFVAKVPARSAAWRELYGTDQMFRKEMDFYNVVVPAYIWFKVMHGRAPESGEAFRDGLEWLPRCYFTVSDGTNTVVLMEDLREAGYRMESRMVGLDLEKSLVVMRSLGKLHAFSYSLQQKDPVVFQDITKLLQETYLTPNADRELVFQENAMSATAAIRDRCPEAADLLAERLEEGLYKLMTKAVSARDRYSVINHGDMWINNLLFRRSGEEGWDVKFVDYQMVRFCSPAGDLSYFLMTSVERKTREEHFDDLLKEYHGSLVRWLDRFGLPTLKSTLPYRELEDQMRKHSFFGIGMALLFLPIFCISAADSPDVGELDGTSFAYLKKMHASGMESEEVRENLASVIRLCCDRGYI